MPKINILVIIGARPQFIKHAAFEYAVGQRFNLVTVHTGQHYDRNMSQVFFDQLGIKTPDYQLYTGSGSHAEQTGKMLIAIEEICIKEAPRYLLVYGDTNSTLAGALAAAKLNIPVIHIEAGIRSFNRQMPEEINRIITDKISSILFCPTAMAVKYLKNEGIQKNVFLSGDIMLDTVRIALEKNTLVPVESLPYYYVTLHRPYNTDNEGRLNYILNTLNQLKYKVILPLHPRTKSKIEQVGLQLNSFTNIAFIEPVSYHENLSYQYYANGVITDSGGMQKEAYILKKKCVTIRSETEWPETLIGQWNTLLFDDLSSLQQVLEAPPGKYQKGLFGDGFAAQKIIDHIEQLSPC